MKKVIVSLMVVLLLVLLSVLVISQQPSISKKTFARSITQNIDLVEKDTCVTEFYEEIEQIRSTCTYFHNYTKCLNTSGLNTACSEEQITWQNPCTVGTQTIQKNKTTCTPNKEFIIEIDNGGAIAKKRLNYADFGPCVFEEQNGCLIITCQSIYDGAHLSQFTGCGSGSSCQKFEICEDSIKTYLKNSKEDFNEDDESFHQEKIELEEVEE